MRRLSVEPVGNDAEFVYGVGCRTSHIGVDVSVAFVADPLESGQSTGMRLLSVWISTYYPIRSAISINVNKPGAADVPFPFWSKHNTHVLPVFRALGDSAVAPAASVTVVTNKAVVYLRSVPSNVPRTSTRRTQSSIPINIS
jgi:hypothetical protein